MVTHNKKGFKLTQQTRTLNRSVHRTVADHVSKLSASSNHPYCRDVMALQIEENPMRAMALGQDIKYGQQRHYFYVAPMIVRPNLDYIAHIDTVINDENNVELDRETLGKNMPDGNRPEYVNQLFVTPPTIASLDVNLSSKMRTLQVTVEGLNNTKNTAYNFVHNVYDSDAGEVRRKLCIASHGDTSDATRLPDLDLAQTFINHFFTDYANNDLPISYVRLANAARRLQMEDWYSYFASDSIDIQITGEYYNEDEDEWYGVDGERAVGTSFVGIYHLQRAFIQTYYPNISLDVASSDLIKAGMDFWHIVMDEDLEYDPANPYVSTPSGETPQRLEDRVIVEHANSYDHVVLASSPENAEAELAKAIESSAINNVEQLHIDFITRETDEALSHVIIHNINQFEEWVDDAPAHRLSDKGAAELTRVINHVTNLLKIEPKHNIEVKYNHAQHAFLPVDVSAVECEGHPNSVIVMNAVNSNKFFNMPIVYVDDNDGSLIEKDETFGLDVPYYMYWELIQGHMHPNAVRLIKREIEASTDYVACGLERITVPGADRLLVKVIPPVPTTKVIRAVFASQTHGMIEKVDTSVAFDYNLEDDIDSFIEGVQHLANLEQCSIVGHTIIDDKTVLIDVQPDSDEAAAEISDRRDADAHRDPEADAPF